MADVSEDDVITIPTAAKLTGIPVRTLQYAASTGALKTTPRTSELGQFYRVTTLRDVHRWEGTYKPRVKK